MSLLPLIELCEIVKSYRCADTEHAALQKVNFSLYSGECIAIMGASGSGKSTLMNILGLLDHPSSGYYFFNCQDVTKFTDYQRAHFRNQTMGFVFQAFHLLPRLTIGQNLALPLQYRGLKSAEISCQVLALLETMQLVHLIHQKPSQLSGGQQQRIAIARAIIGKPQLLLADEPTGALDQATGQMIMDLFIRLNKAAGVTIIIVTHDPNIAAQCQRIVYLKDGTIADY